MKQLNHSVYFICVVNHHKLVQSCTKYYINLKCCYILKSKVFSIFIFVYT